MRFYALIVVSIFFLTGFRTDNNNQVTKEDSSPQVVPHLRGAASPSYPGNYPHKSSILHLLLEKKFDELESKLNGIQQQYERDESGEMYVWHAFKSFANTDPDLEIPLNEWLKKDPRSYSALLANAEYYFYLGRQVRGGNIVDIIRESKFQTMDDLFDIADNYFLKALDVNKQLIPAYVGHIRITKISTHTDLTQKFYLKAMEISPSSYLLNYYILSFLQPKWGGSMSDIFEYLGYISRFYDSNQRLKTLAGYPFYVESDSIKKCVNKINPIDKALAYGDNAFYYFKKGFYYNCAGEYKKASESLTKAIQLAPETVRYLFARSTSYYHLKEYSKSLKDANEAIKLDKYNWRALQQRAQIYLRNKKIDLAETDLLNALIYIDSNRLLEKTYFQLANINLSIKFDFKKATDYLNKAIELNNSYAYYWFLLSTSLIGNHDCSYVDSMKKYLELCEIKGSCNKSRIDLALQSIKKKSTLCYEKIIKEKNK